MIILTETAIKAIRSNTKLKGELQSCLNISGNTLYKWLRENDPKLTSASALEAIRKSTELNDSELLQYTA